TQSQDRGGAAVEGSLSDNAHLRQFEERYRALVHSATDAIVTADSDGRIVSWNAAAERIFGHPADEVVGRPLSVLVPEPLRADHERGLRRFLSTGEARLMGRPVALAGLRRDGTSFPLELSLSTWASSDGSRFLTGIIRDITERRRIQEELA